MVHASVSELWSVLFSEVSNNLAAERSELKDMPRKLQRIWKEGSELSRAKRRNKSLIVIRILRVNDFHMCEWEKTFSTIYFAFPLAVYVHPCHFHNVTHL